MYIFNIIFIIISGIISKFLKDLFKKNQISLIPIIIGIVFFTLSILRDVSVGYDNHYYMIGFNQISGLSDLSLLKEYSWEFGYTIFNKFISLFTNDFYNLIIIYSLIYFTSLIIFITRESKIPWLSFYLFATFGIFHFSLSGYRQSLAMIGVVISLKFIKQKNVFKFLLTIFLASLFHQSVLVFIIIYPISQIEISKKYLINLTITSLVLYFSGGSLINLILKFYSKNYLYIEEGQGLGMLFLLFIITITGLILYKQNPNNSMRLYMHIMLIASILQIVSLHFSLFVRVVEYFSFFIIIFIPNTISNIKSKYLKILAIILTVSLFFAYYIWILNGNPNGTVPYIFKK